MNIVGYRTLKTAIGAVIGIAVAQYLNLDYSVSAGIIVMLSIQNTKRKSIRLAWQRLLTFFIAMSMSTILFTVLGHHVAIFGLFIIFFTPILVRMGMTMSLIINSVLVSHLYLSDTITWGVLGNELALMLIGLCVGVGANMYMPNMEHKVIRLQKDIEAELKAMLVSFSLALKNQCEIDECQDHDMIKEAEKLISMGMYKADVFLNNYVSVDNTYYMSYMDMCENMFHIIKHMDRHFKTFIISREEAEILAEFTIKVSESLFDFATAGKDLEELSRLKRRFKEKDLPKTREEFEDRSILLQFLYDLEEIINIKCMFKRKYLKYSGVLLES
ncbi:MAG: aromatic acid exporter family protein [Firmicutes bacterium]|jgi:uncharacterized membrane protein YgaE (UPF0421/DUF939 family)|nr:aromatic acid exporter family protein [Bacillota bacterium]